MSQHDPLDLSDVVLRDKALRWLVENDDITWMVLRCSKPVIPSGSQLVCDLFYSKDILTFKVALVNMAILMHNERR